MNKKKILSVFLAVIMVCSIVCAAAPSAMAVDVSDASVVVNGITYSFPAYNIGGNNYFKLRDMAYTLSGSDKQFDVGWDGGRNAILLTSGQAYTVVGNEMALSVDSELRYCYPSSSAVYLDDAPISLSAYYINSNNYFKLRDLMAALDIGVDWDESAQTIAIDTGKSYEPEESEITDSSVDSGTKTRLTVEKVAENIDSVLVLYTYDSDGEQLAQGSGFFISADGMIVSNYHVIEGAYSLKGVANDGTEYEISTVLAYDIADDLLLLKASDAENVPYSVLGDSDALIIGEQVVAIGSPYGFVNNVSTGIVSSFRSDPELRSEGVTDIQITAAVSSGSSGGPLYNMYGEVVGINYASYSVGQLLNFSIPINELKALMKNMSSYKLADVSMVSSGYAA